MGNLTPKIRNNKLKFKTSMPKIGKRVSFYKKHHTINKMRKPVNYLKPGIISCLLLLFAVTSCDNEDEDAITLGTSEKTLNYEDEYQIEAASNSDITYTVENEYHASVSESGLVTAKHVGETNIIVSNSSDQKTFKLTIQPEYDLYTEPDVEFQTSKSSIISKYGTADTETESALVYSDYSSTAPRIMFIFDDEDKLLNYAVLVKAEYASTLENFLTERYVLADYNDDYRYFINGLTTKSSSMLVYMHLYSTSYWIVTYLPYSSSNKSAEMKKAQLDINTSEFDKLMEKR